MGAVERRLHREGVVRLGVDPVGEAKRPGGVPGEVVRADGHGGVGRGRHLTGAGSVRQVGGAVEAIRRQRGRSLAGAGAPGAEHAGHGPSEGAAPGRARSRARRWAVDRRSVTLGHLERQAGLEALHQEQVAGLDRGGAGGVDGQLAGPRRCRGASGFVTGLEHAQTDENQGDGEVGRLELSAHELNSCRHHTTGAVGG